MPRAKRPPGPTFTGSLNEPIDLGPGPGLYTLDSSPDTYKELQRKRSQKLMIARLEKLELLAKHYKVDHLEGVARYHALALFLAIDIVRGFQDAGSPQTPRGVGQPKDMEPVALKPLVNGLRGIKQLRLHGRKVSANTNQEACEIIAELFDEDGKDLSRDDRKSDREKRGRTLANRLAPAFGKQSPKAKKPV